jgi:hypothetical protein
VGLQPDQAVDDVHAGLLQRRAHSMLACLVEAGLQLDQRGHLLAPLGGPDERRTIGLSPEVRYSVILMASTFGSTRRLADELLDRVANESYGWWTSTSPSRITAKMSSGSSSPREPGLGDRRPRRVLQVGAVERVHRPQAPQVERASVP